MSLITLYCQIWEALRIKHRFPGCSLPCIHFSSSIYFLHRELSACMSPGFPVLTYKHNLFNLLLSSASLSNFTEVMGVLCPEASLSSSFFGPCCCVSRARSVPHQRGGRKEQQSWDRKGQEYFTFLCTKGRKVRPENPEAETFPAEWLDSDELFSYICPFPMAFYQWLSSSPASLDIKRKGNAQKGVCDRHAAAVINVLIQTATSLPIQLITVQYFRRH